MPKARFNPTRHKSRAARHNPIGGKRNEGAAAATAAEGSNGAAAASTSDETPSLAALREASRGNLDAQSLAIPLLLKLPLPGVEVTPAPSAVDTTWALSSLSLLLTSKPARRSLLAPQHRLLARLVRALSHDDATARAEASGAVRNLCVEGGFATRGKLAKEGALEVVVEQMKTAASSLGIYGDGEAVLTSTAVPTKYVVVDKPLEEMNRKERRHAAKAAAAPAKDDAAMDTGDAPAPANGADEEVVSPALTHLGNLCVILWCILEADSAHLAPLTPYLVSLTALLAATLSRAATSSLHAVPAADASGAEREAGRIRAAEVEAGVAAANALLALVDTHAPAAAALIGIARPELEMAQRAASKKSKSKPPRAIGVLDGADATKQDGTRNLQALDAGVAALEHALKNAGAGALQPISLGLLSLGILRNAAASLPEELRTRVILPGDVQLPAYETTRALPAMLGTIDALGTEWTWTSDLGSREKGTTDEAASPSAGPDDMDTAEDAGAADELDSASSAAPTRAAQRAEERLGALQLALEVLAELASGTDAQDGQDETADDDEEDTWAEDDEMAIDAETATGAVASAGDYASSTPALLFGSGLPTRLLALATPPSTLAFPHSSTAQSEALLTIATRALSALSNLVHALANSAPSPPSAPPASPELAALQTKFSAWRTSTPLLADVWRHTFEAACELGTHGTSASAPLGTAMGVLWALARAHEGTNLPLASSDFPESCPRARAGAGVIPALLEAGLASTDDSLRVGALGALGPLARAPATPHASVAQIGEALVKVLENLPAPGAAAAGGSSAEAATAAINALIDTFADEESGYDSVAFRQNGLLKRINGTTQKVKAMARAIDRRKNPALHEAASEAAENLRGFVQYRSSLKF